jgi:hypothetical protein
MASASLTDSMSPERPGSEVNHQNGGRFAFRAEKQDSAKRVGI